MGLWSKIEEFDQRISYKLARNIFLAVVALAVVGMVWSSISSRIADSNEEQEWQALYERVDSQEHELIRAMRNEFPLMDPAGAEAHLEMAEEICGATWQLRLRERVVHLQRQGLSEKKAWFFAVEPFKTICPAG